MGNGRNSTPEKLGDIGRSLVGTEAIVMRRKMKKKKNKLYSTPNRQMYKLQYLTYQIYNLSNYVRTYIDIMCINIHRRYKKMININNVLWGR